jgi:DNA-binding HxlR family transcriptional regulator
MKRKNFDHLQCPVAATLSVIGDHWSILIVRDLFFGMTRFDEFQTDLGIARNILADRLKKLVDEGIVDKVATTGTHAEYRLTEDGQALRKVLISMARWGETHRPAKSGEGDWRTLGRAQEGRPQQDLAPDALETAS